MGRGHTPLSIPTKHYITWLRRTTHNDKTLPAVTQLTDRTQRADIHLNSTRHYGTRLRTTHYGIDRDWTILHLPTYRPSEQNSSPTNQDMTQPIFTQRIDLSGLFLSEPISTLRQDPLLSRRLMNCSPTSTELPPYATVRLTSSTLRYRSYRRNDNANRTATTDAAFSSTIRATSHTTARVKPTSEPCTIPLETYQFDSSDHAHRLASTTCQNSTCSTHLRTTACIKPTNPNATLLYLSRPSIPTIQDKICTERIYI